MELVIRSLIWLILGGTMLACAIAAIKPFPVLRIRNREHAGWFALGIFGLSVLTLMTLAARDHPMWWGTLILLPLEVLALAWLWWATQTGHRFSLIDANWHWGWKVFTVFVAIQLPLFVYTGVINGFEKEAYWTDLRTNHPAEYAAYVARYHEQAKAIAKATAEAKAKQQAEKAAAEKAEAELATEREAERLGRLRVVQAERVVKERLKDPESARFGKIYWSGKAACGSVNAKNSFGGYTGAKPFIFVASMVIMPEDVGTKEFEKLLDEMC